jgi:hypothetical protein
METLELALWSPKTMIEVSLNSPDDFLKVKETLTRIGLPSKDCNKLFQTCHILHKQGRYFIVHFKELFLLDGKTSTFTIEDLGRRNAIATLLSDWGLVTIVNKPEAAVAQNLKSIKIIPFRDKANWVLESKYSIGKVKLNRAE